MAMNELARTAYAQGDVEAALEAAADPKDIQANDGRQYSLLPPGWMAKDMTDPSWQPGLPKRVFATAGIQTKDALIRYVNRFKSPDTVLFANIAESKIVGVIDYHHSVREAADAPIRPDYALHRAVLPMVLSQEWSLWAGKSGRMMSQLDFARLIEENARDLHSPDGATLLEIVRDLYATRSSEFTNVVRTATDHQNFAYKTETQAATRTGNIELPGKLELFIPVYLGEQSTLIDAYLRWNLDDGRLVLGVELKQAERVRQAAFMEVAEAVEEATGCVLIYGTP